jgi:two-component system NtrC family sensor kinase
MSKSILTVLIASETAEEIKLITKSVRAAYPGCRVEAVYSAEEILESAARDEWSVILLDEMLPRQCGRDVLPELKRRAPRSAIIFLAERNESGIAVHTMRTGADYYIWKKSATFLLDLPGAIREVLEKLDLRTRLDLANERYRRLIETMTDLVYELDEEGRFVYVSNTIETLLGYTPAEVIGTHYSTLVHPEDGTKAALRFNERRTGVRGTRNLELRLLHKDRAHDASKSVEVEVNAVGLHGPHRRFLGTVGVVQNLSRRKQEESRLRQMGDRLQHAERLKELGQFIAGIAHELNNPLTSICGYTDLLLGQINETGLVNHLKMVASEAARAAQIVKELLIFARPQPVERSVVSVSQAIHCVLASKAQELSAHAIHSESRISEGTPSVLCDEPQLQQILLNLITNAQYAMWEKDRGGRLVLASQSVGVAENRRMVEIQVIDSGPGIPAEDRRRIFTPFFTKKKGGQGTGLGLAIVERLVQENGGTIEVDEAPGGGARFRIRLPAADGVPDRPPSMTLPSTAMKQTASRPGNVDVFAPPTGGTASAPHVIVVEDERSIRYLISTVLAQEGYRVTVCENGQQGLQQVRQALNSGQTCGKYHDPALILSDFQMPGMNGREFFGGLRTIAPDLPRRLVFITGDTMNNDITHLIAQTGNSALAKPFTPIQLVQIVRKALSNQSPPEPLSLEAPEGSLVERLRSPRDSSSSMRTIGESPQASPSL